MKIKQGVIKTKQIMRKEMKKDKLPGISHGGVKCSAGNRAAIL